MKYTIKINKAKNPGSNGADFNNIPMGRTFTDHMFICDYRNGAWNEPRIEPLHPVPTHPAAMALHYGQAIFEGMKATVNAEGTPLLFRPEENAKRLNFSAVRMGMPQFPEDLFVEALKELVAIEQDWIPTKEGNALYLRPFMYADEPFIGMRAATTYKFIIIAAPAGAFFTKPIRLYAETQHIRAADGGTGEAKTAGNYAAAIYPTEMAKAKGYDQVLWLDAFEYKYIQEVGTMNIFFKINGKFVTPPTGGTILRGITRDSIITILRDCDFEVEERPVSIDEVIEASRNGTLEEAFGTGTAVGIAMIKEIGYKDTVIPVAEKHPVGQMVLDTFNGIRSGRLEDTHNWLVEVHNYSMSS